MIGFAHPLAEPEAFDERCRQRGQAWLLGNPQPGRPRDYWSPFRPLLAESFCNRCAFGAMYIPSGTVEHFISCDEDRSMAYEWSNYRYVDAWMNSAKGSKKAEDFLDPLEVREGWFEVLLPSLQLVMTDRVPEAFRARAEYTLQHLPLRDDERVMRVRRQWLRLYEDGKIGLAGLRDMAPLIAAAVERRGTMG
jgi:hypothetical protein